MNHISPIPDNKQAETEAPDLVEEGIKTQLSARASSLEKPDFWQSQNWRQNQSRIIALQRSIGNQAVMRLLKNNPTAALSRTKPADLPPKAPSQTLQRIYLKDADGTIAYSAKDFPPDDSYSNTGETHDDGKNGSDELWEVTQPLTDFIDEMDAIELIKQFNTVSKEAFDAEGYSSPEETDDEIEESEKKTTKKKKKVVDTTKPKTYKLSNNRDSVKIVKRRRDKTGGMKAKHERKLGVKLRDDHHLAVHDGSFNNDSFVYKPGGEKHEDQPVIGANYTDIVKALAVPKDKDAEVATAIIAYMDKGTALPLTYTENQKAAVDELIAVLRLAENKRGRLGLVLSRVTLDNIAAGEYTFVEGFSKGTKKGKKNLQEKAKFIGAKSGGGAKALKSIEAENWDELDDDRVDLAGEDIKKFLKRKADEEEINVVDEIDAEMQIGWIMKDLVEEMGIKPSKIVKK